MNILNLIKELRTKRKFLQEQASSIDKRIKQLKKQHFDADEEKEFTFELLEAVLTNYLTETQITQVIKQFEVSYIRLRAILDGHLTVEQIDEIIEKLKEI